MYLLDTNVVSEFRRVRPHGGVVAWVKSVPESALFISAVTMGEIQTGIEITRAQNSEKALELQLWADQLATSYTALPMDVAAFRLCATLMHKRSNSLQQDAMIAATALMHQLTVVTRNVRDFQPFGVAVLNPFGPVAA